MGDFYDKHAGEVWLLIFVVTAIYYFHNNDSTAYTLYRTSLGNERVHVATFNVKNESDTYNSYNCSLAASLFQNQPDVKMHYWCEPGRFKK